MKDLCGLANGSPAEPRGEGALLVGISNDGTALQPVRNTQFTDDHLQHLVRTYLAPPPDVRLHEVVLEDGDERHVLKVVTVAAPPDSVVRIARDVQGGRGGLLHRRNEVWVRHGATSELASPEDILRLHEREHPRAPVRAPRLTLTARATPDAPPAAEVVLQVPILGPLDPARRAREVAALVHPHRPMDMRGVEEVTAWPGAERAPFRSRVHPAEVDRYEAEAAAYPAACEAYVDAEHAYQARRVRCAYLYLDVENAGTGPATHAVLMVTAPAGVELAPAAVGPRTVRDFSRPRPPTPPTPPRLNTVVALNAQPLPPPIEDLGAAPRPRPQPESVRGPVVLPAGANADESSGGETLRYELGRVSHGDPVPLAPVAVVFANAAAARDVALSYVLRADELSESVVGEITVRVVAASPPPG